MKRVARAMLGGEVVWVSNCERFRIVATPDYDSSMEDLKGDTFNRAVNPEIPEERMAEEERAFDETVERDGVWGFTLERWDPSPNCGWEMLDSCWGFVGYDADFIEELKDTAKQSGAA